MVFLDRSETFDGEFLWLAVDKLMVSIAEEDEVLLAIPLLGDQRRLATWPLRAFANYVRHLADHHQSVGWPRYGEDSPAAGEGAAAPGSHTEFPLVTFWDWHTQCSDGWA